MADPNNGWSKYPTRVIVEEKGKVELEEHKRMTEQLQAVCEVHAATSNALNTVEEQNLHLRQEVQRLENLVEVLQEQNTELCKEKTYQQHQQVALKDKCIAAHEKLGTLSDYQMERSDLLTQLRQQSEAVASLKQQLTEAQASRCTAEEDLEKKVTERDLHKRQAEAQLRCNEIVTAECTRLKNILARTSNKHGRKDERIVELTEEVADLQKALKQVEFDMKSQEKVALNSEQEGRFLKRERTQALKSLEDERDTAGERELLIRTLRRDNQDLKAQVAVLVNEAEQRLDEAAATHQVLPIPVMEVGVKPPKKRSGKDPLLANLKQQNKLQMRSLTNTLQQLMFTIDNRERHAPSV